MDMYSRRWFKRAEATQKRLQLKERAVAFLGGACHVCGYQRCPSAFDFHHPNPDEKEFSVSTRSAWSPKLEAELKKCILLCATCHREVHAGWHPSLLDLQS